MAKGKLPEGYKGVEKLIKEFRDKNPKGKIQTSPVVLDDGFVLVTATITTDDGAVGSGMAQADVQEEKSVQKAESGAIRRALLTLGFESEESEESEEKEERTEKRSFKREEKEEKPERRSESAKEADEDEEEEEQKEEKPRSRFGNKSSDSTVKSEKRRDDTDDSDEEQEEGESRFKRGSRFQRN
jgi:hypothetical protein